MCARDVSFPNTNLEVEIGEVLGAEAGFEMYQFVNEHRYRTFGFGLSLLVILAAPLDKD